MSDTIPMTREAYERKRKEVERLEFEVMPEVTEKLAAARAEGDLKENAEYHAQREEQGLLQAKINKLKDELARAVIVDPDTLPKDEVAFGATVVVEDQDLGDTMEITLVGDGDQDNDNGRFLITSPLGQGLVGKKKGEVAEIEVPMGTLRYKILDIRYEM